MSKKKILTLLVLITAGFLTIQLFHDVSSVQHYIFRKTPPVFYTSPLINTSGNIPDSYFNTDQQSRDEPCARFPSLFDLRIRNDNWQVQSTSNGTFHLFNAYVDRRNGTVIRILGTYDHRRPQQPFYCQYWYDGSTRPLGVRSETLFWMFREKWGADTKKFHHPYLITCPLGDGVVPTSVSLVENLCDHATNNLKVIDNKPGEKKDFVVCVKGLSFPFEDQTVRLVEWIELLGILGVDKINFYEFSVHPNTKRLLDYYVTTGRVEVTPLTLVQEFSNRPLLQARYFKKKLIDKRLQEVIPYNDCLYKHLNAYKYVVLLDTDEVIVPFEGTWPKMLETIQQTYPNRSSYTARNVYFLDSYLHNHEWFDGIPRYMHMLQHVYRSVNYTNPGAYVKGFHDTDKVLSLHNHFPFACLGPCNGIEIDIQIAHLQHYRSTCVAELNCTSMKLNSVMDTRLWNFRDELVERVGLVGKVLGLFGDEE